MTDVPDAGPNYSVHTEQIQMIKPQISARKDTRLHKFIRTPTLSSHIWKCVDCKWFVHAGQAYRVIGKWHKCWTCNETFQMSVDAMQNEMPVCDECSRKDRL
jgi:formylmethanofuran dehydrogenase subunit E